MKKKKYLSLYFEWLKEGYLPKSGLCLCFLEDDLFEIFIQDSPVWGFWGYDGSIIFAHYSVIKNNRLKKLFTPLRQNIVLLMAATNGEL